MYTFKFSVNNTAWTVKCGSFFPKIFGAAANSIGHTTRIVSGYCPDAESLAHEWFHIASTSTFRYVVSIVIGWLWDDSYHKNQEIGANLFGKLHKTDSIFVTSAATIRAALPADWETVTIEHKV